MAGTLFVVATPIGNLEDITLRAIRVLREVAVVAAEDTRRTGLLLRHFGILTRLISLHAHNEGLKAEGLVDRLRRGESVALVSDAGTPAVSDPGAELVRAAVAAGVRVEAVPGASAVMAALSTAGLPDVGFTFLGFPPIRGNNRKGWFDSLDRAVEFAPVVFFEAPHRIKATLGELVNRQYNQIIVFRELTKLHESVYRGSIDDVIGQMTMIAGEFTVVVPRLTATDGPRERPTDQAVLDLIGQITDKRGRDAARQVAAAVGLSANEVYEIVRKSKA
ncbi:MAG: 16S rRNA (cytidine(1402)-2'-O)-methyltransferase [Acidobacteria bacterium]|nr:16S rRNA (cytidine(1402)-2'-O)-methyltransferase [Acidobacteriota bacterium]